MTKDEIQLISQSFNLEMRSWLTELDVEKKAALQALEGAAALIAHRISALSKSRFEVDKFMIDCGF